MVLLDTHVWLWWLLGDGNLSEAQRTFLDEKAARTELALSWVSVWELEMLERKQRVSLLPDFPTWTQKATDSSFIKLLPADTELVFAQRNLPEDFHGDPADRLIATTSLLTGFPLATFDSKILSHLEIPISDAFAK